MNLKPLPQLRPPKGRGTISSKIIKKAVKKVAAKRELVQKASKTIKKKPKVVGKKSISSRSSQKK